MKINSNVNFNAPPGIKLIGYGKDLYNAYSSTPTVSSARELTNSSYFRRLFDPQGASAMFNAQEAQKTREFNAQEAQKTREFNAQQSQIARDFEERMSNTAYSRAIADLRANGLNPYLVMSGGASTPSGQVVSSPTAHGVSASVNGASNMQSIGTAFNSFGNFAQSVWNIAKSAMYLAKYGF